MSPEPNKNRVAIVGAHGSGKTTLAHEVVALLKRRGIAVSLCREAARESHYLTQGRRVPEMQIDVFARQLSAEMEALRTSELVLCDRSLLDIHIYAQLFFPGRIGLTEQAFLASMEQFVSLYMPTYRLLFRTTALYSLTETPDAIRPTDARLQRDFHERLESELKRRNLNYVDIPSSGGASFVVERICRDLHPGSNKS